MKQHDLIIVGAGPAGLAAAIAAREAGIQDILLLERDSQCGGILNQCIHNGFGLHTFKEELTGPEYAARYTDMAKDIPVQLDTMVLDISPERQVTCISQEKGLEVLQAKAIVLAMGCRERPRGALSIPGSRPAGIYSAGTAQKLVNLDGFLPGKDVVILGSGDIGLIMARRMMLEGAKVHVVAELLPYSGGLKRNIVQCLEDYGIPLKLGHTVTNIQGKERVEAVTIAQVDKNRQPIAGTEITYPCDTLLLSCGLIPENELSRQAGIQLSGITNGPIVNESLETSVPGIFACGNVLHVHDLVDFVSQEAQKAGQAAAAYIQAERETADKKEQKKQIPIETGGLVRYTVPFQVNPDKMDDNHVVRFRVGAPARNVWINVIVDGETKIHQKKRILAPGEMEAVILKKAWFTPETTCIGIETEEGQ